MSLLQSRKRLKKRDSTPPSTWSLVATLNSPVSNICEHVCAWVNVNVYRNVITYRHVFRNTILICGHVLMYSVPQILRDTHYYSSLHVERCSNLKIIGAAFFRMYVFFQSRKSFSQREWLGNRQNLQTCNSQSLVFCLENRYSPPLST